jgi:uncharacterized nucleotidyltransferase DUF6036
MNRDELTLLLTELDEALAQAFPGPEPVRVLVVGGACLLLAGITERPTRDIDVIITNIAALRRLLHVESRAQAEWVVNRFFPDPLLQRTYDLPKTLDDLFGKKG